LRYREAGLRRDAGKGLVGDVDVPRGDPLRLEVLQGILAEDVAADLGDHRHRGA
jgi:hypothetical protein